MGIQGIDVLKPGGNDLPPGTCPTCKRPYGEGPGLCPWAGRDECAWLTTLEKEREEGNLDDVERKQNSAGQ